MSRRVRWGLGITVIAAALILGFILMIVPENHDTLVNQVHHVVQLNGWRVTGLVIAASATLAALGLGLLEAFDATEHPERHHETE